ncbi:MAG: hypothetical protein OXH76_02355, partial [Boseongicola sp.]|nr:hypothetical protein [Boseongicola sp.]
PSQGPRWLTKLLRSSFVQFEKVDDEICANRQRWRIRRFLTIGLFAYSKLAIYQDLDRKDWPSGHELVAHRNIRTLLAQSGVSDIPEEMFITKKVDAVLPGIAVAALMTPSPFCR